MPRIPEPRYLGADPGQSGGIAWVGATCFGYAMPETERGLYCLLEELQGEYDFKLCYLEKVHSMPAQGVASSFKFGVNVGLLRMALIATNIPFQEVTPQAWQKGLGLRHRKKGEPQGDWKRHLLAVAQQLFPTISVTLKTADALLIAEWCRRSQLQPRSK